MDELIKAVLDRIDNELDRCYWNKNQKNINSPFQNTGETYSNDVFTVRAYSWNDDEELKPNFESKFLECSWYKHSHRGLNYNIKYNARSEENELEQLANFLNDCIKAIRKDFGER